MLPTIVAILLKAFVVLVVAQVVPGIRIEGYKSALSVAVVYAVLSWALKWLLVVLTFPFIIVTFGLFLFVLNGALLWLTDKLIESFEIKSFPSLAMATIGMTIGGVIVDLLVGKIF